MSVANAKCTVTSSWVGGQVLHVIGTIAVDPSPATYATGGIPMNLRIPGVTASRTPTAVLIQGTGGFSYAYIPGTHSGNGLLKVLATYAGEHTVATIIAGVSSDTITFHAFFSGQN